LPSSTILATPARPDALGASTFWVLGADRDESGGRSRIGYAFVIHAGAESSDLLTDYDLVVGRYLRGERTIDLGHGARTFAATIVAVSPDPHVALLRIGGTFPALPIAIAPPHVGDTVVLGEDATVPAPRATIVVHPTPGRPHHLTFSVAVADLDDGTPVLNLNGRVVGISEPSAPFGTDDLGFAVPIHAGCLAVQVC
jgi:S1-C subfamily serine protease